MEFLCSLLWAVCSIFGHINLDNYFFKLISGLACHFFCLWPPTPEPLWSEQLWLLTSFHYTSFILALILFLWHEKFWYIYIKQILFKRGFRMAVFFLLKNCYFFSVLMLRNSCGNLVNSEKLFFKFILFKLRSFKRLE